jgi:hypothetical protein
MITPTEWTRFKFEWLEQVEAQPSAQRLQGCLPHPATLQHGFGVGLAEHQAYRRYDRVA